MQGHDTDRLHMDAKDYSVTCLQCGNTFEATRSDATFCSARCRVAHSREPQKLANALQRLEDMRFQVIGLAEKYKGNPDILQALVMLKSAVASAEYLAEFTD